MGVAAYPVIAAGGGYSLYKGHQYANPQDPYAAPPGGVSPLFSPQAAQRLVVNNLAGETAAPEIRKRREDAVGGWNIRPPRKQQAKQGKVLNQSQRVNYL